MSDTPRTDGRVKFVRGGGSPDRMEHLCRELERELAAANKRADEAERDAARYRYLREVEVSQPRVECVIRINGNLQGLVWGDALDAAIDEAMKNG